MNSINRSITKPFAHAIFGILFTLCITVLAESLLCTRHVHAFQVQSTAIQAGNKVVRWAKMPVAINLHISGAPDITDGSDLRAIREAFQTWSEPTCNDLVFSFEITNTTSFAGRKADPTDPLSPYDRDTKSVVRFETQTWELEWSALEMARTATHFDPQTGMIREADLLFNAVHFKWSTNQKSNTLDIKTVAINRIGFMIGLWFSEIPGSMMHHTTDLMRTRHHLGSDDIDGSCFLYPIDGWKDPPPPPPKEPPKPDTYVPPPDTKPQESISDHEPWFPPDSGSHTDLSSTTDTANSLQGCGCNATSHSYPLFFILLFFLAVIPYTRKS
jgi:hypothetical protein